MCPFEQRGRVGGRTESIAFYKRRGAVLKAAEKKKRIKWKLPPPGLKLRIFSSTDLSALRIVYFILRKVQNTIDKWLKLIHFYKRDFFFCWKFVLLLTKPESNFFLYRTHDNRYTIIVYDERRRVTRIFVMIVAIKKH